MKKFKIIGVSTALIVGTFLTIMNLGIPNTAMANPSKLSRADYANGTKRAADAAQRVKPRLAAEMRGKGIAIGNPVYLRLFKESREMEMWVQHSHTKKFVLFKTYKVAAMSGRLGPKQKEGDMQAPEGFYYVNRGRMNPQSRFHLAFNMGYPNTYDKAYGRTGSALMVHGNRVSVGCFAMTDYYVEEIYTICDAALKKNQPFFRVHSFPFRMTEQRMARSKNSQWYGFWQNLKQGYDAFEKTRVPPNVNVSSKTYRFK